MEDELKAMEDDILTLKMTSSQSYFRMKGREHERGTPILINIIPHSLLTTSISVINTYYRL